MKLDTRIPESLRNRVADYAAQTGLSFGDAVEHFIWMGLDAEPLTAPPPLTAAEKRARLDEMVQEFGPSPGPVTLKAEVRALTGSRQPWGHDPVIAEAVVRAARVPHSGAEPCRHITQKGSDRCVRCDAKVGG